MWALFFLYFRNNYYLFNEEKGGVLCIALKTTCSKVFIIQE